MGMAEKETDDVDSEMDTLFELGSKYDALVIFPKDESTIEHLARLIEKHQDIRLHLCHSYKECAVSILEEI